MLRAEVGDRIHVHSRVVDSGDRTGEVLEVRGSDGGPPYLVRFANGQENLIFPGPDTTVEPAR